MTFVLIDILGREAFPVAGFVANTGTNKTTGTFSGSHRNRNGNDFLTFPSTHGVDDI